MEKVKRKISGKSFLMVFMIFVFTTLHAGSVLAGDQMIARLTGFSGQIMIKSNGHWGTEPRENLPLFSEDKVVTRAGRATITFLDGAVMEMRPNSNLLIQETEEEDPSTKTKIIKRKLRLLLGKLLFRTGRIKNSTVLQTPTAVCGLRGTEGVLSIDAGGQPYIYFSEGETSYTVGDFVSGVAQDVPAELADLNPAQRAAFVAQAAAEQAQSTAAKLEAGEITDAEAALMEAEAAEAAAREAKAAAESMLNNPDPEVQAEAGMAVVAAEKAIQESRDAQEDIKNNLGTSDSGETGEPETYTQEPPSGGTDVNDQPDLASGPDLGPDIPPTVDNTTEETPSLLGLAGGGDMTNGFWLRNAYDDGTTTLKYLTDTTYGTGVGISSEAGIEDLGNGTWQPAPGQWTLTEKDAMGGTLDTDIGHTAVIESGTYDYGEGGAEGSYYYTYYRPSAGIYEIAYTTDDRPSEGMATYTYYISDGTLSIERYNYSTQTWEYEAGTWNPETFDLAQLATPPADAPDSVKTWSYNVPTTVDSGWMEGLIGWTDNPWAADSAVHAMGNIEHDGNSIIGGYAAGEFFDGFMGGIENNDDLEVLLSAVAVDDQQRAGFISGKLIGKSYSASSMFALDGLSDWTVMNEDIGFEQAELSDHIYRGEDIGVLGLAGRFDGSANSRISMDYGGDPFYGDINYGDEVNYGYWSFNTISIMNNETDKTEDWGVFGASLGGTFENPDLKSSWKAHFGGEAEFGNSGDGYFLAETSSTWADGKLSASVSGKFLTPELMGDLNGQMLGTYYGTTSGTWEGVALGAYEGKPLDMYALWEGDKLISYGNSVGNEWGIVGTIADGANYHYLAMGQFMEDGGGGPYVWSSEILDPDTEERDAFVGGVWKDGQMNGHLAALFEDEGPDSTLTSLGFYYKDVTGNYYGVGSYYYGEDDVYNQGMWMSEGTLSLIEVFSNPGGDPYYINYDLSGPGDMCLANVGGTINIDSDYSFGESDSFVINNENDPYFYQVVGIWQTILNGDYSGTPGNGWSMSLEDIYDYPTRLWMEVGSGSDDGVTQASSQWANNEISAYAAGAWVDIDAAATGVGGGKLVGTFDPSDSSNQLWQAVAGGSILDTATFLNLAETNPAVLQSLDIPYIKVGETSLSGNGIEGSNLLNVQMDNVKFFAYSTSAAPRIWATGNVQGTTNGSDPTGSTAILSGSGNSAVFNSVSFTMNNYNNSVGGKWDASVNGAGTVNNHAIDIKGGAAGMVTGTGVPGTTSGTFSGTGAGVARPSDS